MPTTPIVFDLMILACLADHDLGHIHGGPSSLVAPIKKRYEELGGAITTNARVLKILTKSNKAYGVKLADGSEHLADIIISAADGYSTIYDMLDGNYTDASITERFETWPMFKPILMISYGTTLSLPNEISNQFIRLDKPFALTNQTIDKFLVRVFNYDPELNPPSKTVVQVEVETDFDYWNTLALNNRSEYDREKDRVAAVFLEKLESFYPGISTHVEMMDVATPYTLWRYTLNHKGAFEGWLPASRTLFKNVKKTLPGLSNFYMAGQWVEPGGGIITAMYSGRHAIQYVCRDDKKKFRVTL
jgi:phytoene dehydrogenase-like protein